MKIEGKYNSTQELEAALCKQAAEWNASPLPEKDNLSPNEMRQILYFTFRPQSLIGFKEDADPDLIMKIPFLQLMVEFLLIVEKAGTLKLTTRGNLPRKVVFELYGKGFIKEPFLENGIIKLSKEEDSITLQNTKIISILAGLTKKRNNKLSLTATGNKLLNQPSRKLLFQKIFLTNCQKFNLGYHDGFPQEVNLLTTFGFTLYLLLKYGKENRNFNFYNEKHLIAFPQLLDYFESGNRSREIQLKRCYKTRVFIRFLDFYGFIKFKRDPAKSTLVYENLIDLSTTDLFREVFELKG